MLTHEDCTYSLIYRLWFPVSSHIDGNYALPNHKSIKSRTWTVLTTLNLSFFVQGIVKALQEYQKKLLEHKVDIFVRRGGPNYQEGLRVMREIG